MHILYIHQYFATPKGTTGTRSYEFARRWVRAGHDVVMLTTTAQLCEQDLRDSTGCFVKRTTIDGIDVRAINLPYNQKMGFVKRGFSFIGFVFIASVYVLFIKKVDIIYATSTPLTIGIPAMMLKLFKRKPFVFEVRDQWPEIPVELGIVKNKILIKLLLSLEKRIYKSASAVVALSPGMSAGVREVIGENKLIETVPNSSDTAVFRPDIDGSDIRKKHGWENKFVLIHFGAMGKANGLDFLVQAADKLKDSTDIHFVVIGDGTTRQPLVEKANQLGLKNIEFLGSITKNVLPKYVAGCDVSTVIFANYPILEHNSANKFFDSLSAGKPILLNYSGWQKEVLEKGNAGYGCRQSDLDGFIDKILYLKNNPDELPVKGANARKIAEEQFSRDKLASKVLSVLEKTFSEL